MRTVFLALGIVSTIILVAAEPSQPLEAGSSSSARTLFEQGLANALVVSPSGELILWDIETGRGFVLGGSPVLAAVEEFRGPRSPQLALSSGGRRAFLIDGNRTVEIHLPDGTRRRLDLKQELGGMAWLDDERLAVSPTNGDFLVEVWDFQSGKLLQGIEKTEPILEEPGFKLLRATELAWDPERRRLHTLDAYSGYYRAYDLSKGFVAGANEAPTEPLYAAQVNDRHRQRYEERTAALDREFAERGEFQGTSIWRFDLGLDAHGTAWMVESCDRDGDAGAVAPGTAHLLAVDPEGAEHRLAIETPCCSLQAVPWGERLVFARSGRPGVTGCFATVPLPSIPPARTGSFWLEASPLLLRATSLSRRITEPPSILERFDVGAGPAEVLERLGAREDLVPGLTLVCTGGEDRPVDCRQLWLDPEAPDGLELRPRPGRPVTGRVTLEGVGMGGASVALVPADFKTTRLLTLPLILPEGAEEPVREVETDQDGRFTLPALAPGDYRLLLELPGGRRDHETTFTVTPPRRTGSNAGTRTPATVEPLDVLDLGDLDFPAGLSVEVLVAGPDGQPIPGALVGAVQAGPDRARNPAAVTELQAGSDESGHAVLGGLSPDLPASVVCRAPGYEIWRERFDAPPSFVACTLVPLGRLTGRVVDEEGASLSAARVTLSGSSSFSGPWVETAEVGGEDEGRFRFEDLEEGHLRLVAASPGHAAKTLSLTLEPGEARDVGELVLEPGTRWMHRVVEQSPEAEREPVAGATITAVAPPGSLAPATTDTWGETEVEGPATGPLTVEVQAEGFAPRRVEVPETARTLDAEPFEIVLERGGWIEAHVWDEATGAPCAGCQVSLSGSGPGQGLVTDASGTARSGPLAPGPWQASLSRVQGFGGMVTRSGGHDVRRVTVAPGETTEVRFGDPAQTVEVVVSPPPVSETGGPEAWQLVVRDLAGAVRLYALDASGSAIVRRPEGAAVLSLTGGGTTVELGTLAEDATDPALIERPSGLLTCRLPASTDGNGPVPGRTRLELVNLGDGRRVATVDAEPGSVVRIPFLATGVYELRGGGRSLGTAAVVDGRETSLGDLGEGDGPGSD